jgi:hypothetical protein
MSNNGKGKGKGGIVRATPRGFRPAPYDAHGRYDPYGMRNVTEMDEYTENEVAQDWDARGQTVATPGFLTREQAERLGFDQPPPPRWAPVAAAMPPAAAPPMPPAFAPVAAAMPPAFAPVAAAMPPAPVAPPLQVCQYCGLLTWQPDGTGGGSCNNPLCGAYEYEWGISTGKTQENCKGSGCSVSGGKRKSRKSRKNKKSRKNRK